MTQSALSVVAIGRNESRNLQDLEISLKSLRDFLPCETVFVDSASSDDSAQVANHLFDKTVVLEADARLNASAGRFAGVSVSAHPWLLFLDGDMQLDAGFATEIVRHVERDDQQEGLVGTYVHVFEDGSERRWSPEVDAEGFVLRFGGAVMLHRKMLESQNWDPRLFSNEEIDLYARLRGAGFRIRGVAKDFIRHRNESVPLSARVKGMFWPVRSFLGKKFFGMGQLVRCRVSAGTLPNLIRWFPGPFALWSALALSMLLLAGGQYFTAALLAALSSSIVVLRYSLRSLVYFVALLPQTLFGLRHYSPDWRPTISTVLTLRSDRTTS